MYAGWRDEWVEEGTIVMHNVYIHFGRAFAPAHAGTRRLFSSRFSTYPTRGSSPSHTWRELWREGAVLAGVERGRCRTEVCRWVCMCGCMGHVDRGYAGGYGICRYA
jgi:hypothetical protein